jgi:hypothetical protein
MKSGSFAVLMNWGGCTLSVVRAFTGSLPVICALLGCGCRTFKWSPTTLVLAPFILLCPNLAHCTDVALSGPFEGFQIHGTSSLLPQVHITKQLTAAGDVNMDGLDDILITSYSLYSEYTYVVMVTVVFGSSAAGGSDLVIQNPSLSPTKSINIIWNTSLGAFVALGTVGDLNDDGIDDFALGDWLYDPFSREYAGAAVVIFGKTTGWADIDLASFTSGSAGFWIYGAAGDHIGLENSCGHAGDVNSDGISDIIVAKWVPSDGPFVVAYVIFGHGTATAPFTDIDLSTFTSGSKGFEITTGAAGLGSYIHVATARDINGDGYDDLLIEVTLKFFSFVLFGPFSSAGVNLGSLSASQGFRIIGDDSRLYIRSAGDFNNDGFADVVLGTSSATALSRTYAGIAYILLGHSTTTAFPDIDLPTFTSGTSGLAVYGGSNADALGWAVDGGADVNGDGIDDVLVASRHSEESVGMVVVLFGRVAASFKAVDLAANLPYNMGYKIMGARNGRDYFSAGASVVLVPSFNGDDFADITIGMQSGAAYTLYGSATAFPTAVPTFFACSAGTHHLSEGSSVCVDCLSGHSSSTIGSLLCAPCPAGWEAPSPRSTECVQCEEGYFAALNGTASCSKCTAGSYTDAKGTAACKLPPPGTYADGEGATSYQSCPVNTYQPSSGGASCIQCPNNRITALPGRADPSDCVLPTTNFLFAGLALLLVAFVFAVYILAGRVHSIAYGRMRFIREAKEQYQWLIDSVQRLEQSRGASARHAATDTPGTLWRWLRPVVWVVAEAAVLVYGVLSSSLFVLGKVFFFAMVIWRNIHIQFPHLNFMDQIASALAGIGDVVGPTLLAVVRAIASAFNWFANIPIDLSAAEVTCKGSSAPVTLLIDVCIFVRVICLVDCDIAVFLQTTFGDAHVAFRRALTLPHLDALLPYDFRTKVLLWLGSYVESSLVSPSVVVTVLQLLLGFVSIAEFFDHGGVHEYTPGCNTVQGYEGYDKVAAVLTSCICYYLIIPVAYTVLKFLVPRLPVRTTDRATTLAGEKAAVEAQVAMYIRRHTQRAATLEGWVQGALSQQVAACKEASICAKALAEARLAYEERVDAIEQWGDVRTALPSAQEVYAEAVLRVKFASGYLCASRAQLAGGYGSVTEDDVQSAEQEVRQAEAHAATARAAVARTRSAPDSPHRCHGVTAPSTPITPVARQINAASSNSASTPDLDAPFVDTSGRERVVSRAAARGCRVHPLPPSALEAHTDQREANDSVQGPQCGAGVVFREDPELDAPFVGPTAREPVIPRAAARGGQVHSLLPSVVAARAVSIQLREAEFNYKAAVRQAQLALRALAETVELAEAAAAAAITAAQCSLHTSKAGVTAPQPNEGGLSQGLTCCASSCLVGPFVDSVQPLVSLLQPDDSWLSWRFRWAYKTLRTRTVDEHATFVFPLSAELRRGLDRPHRVGPILRLPWSAVPEDEAESEGCYQVDWNVERFSRLTPCGFLPVVTCYKQRAVLLANLRTIIEIYLCGVWNSDSVAMFGLRDLLDSCGVDTEAVKQAPGDSVSTALYRLFTGDFASTREAQRGGTGDAHRIAVSSILYAKLVPRATLCLLFPYGAFVAIFVNNTAAYPLWCRQAAYLDDRLPRILVFEAWALAEERVAEGGNRVYWKVLFTAINIFVMESRLTGYLFGLLQFLMALAVLFLPSRGFLAFGTVLIGLYSLCSSLRLMVSVANLFEEKVTQDKCEAGETDEPVSTASPVKGALAPEQTADVEAPNVQEEARLLCAVMEIRAYALVTQPDPVPIYGASAVTCEHAVPVEAWAPTGLELARVVK